MKTVDVIIPVYKPGREFEDLLNRLDHQTVSIQTILLMHTLDGCELPGIRLKQTEVEIEEIKPEEFDHGGTRDKAARKSKADILIFMTQDALPENDRLIENLIQPLEDERVAVAYARQIPRRDCQLTERYTRSFNYPGKSRVKSKKDLDSLGIKTFFCSNVCAAYNRNIYQELGGFQENLIFNEDMIFASKCIRKGFYVVYEADAIVIHSHNYTLREQFSRNFDMAVSQIDHPEVFRGVSSEQEGIKMVKRGLKYFVSQRRPATSVYFVLECGVKYLGYRLGKRYGMMPPKLVKTFSMNKKYWKGRCADKC